MKHILTGIVGSLFFKMFLIGLIDDTLIAVGILPHIPDAFFVICMIILPLFLFFFSFLFYLVPFGVGAPVGGFVDSFKHIYLPFAIGASIIYLLFLFIINPILA